MIRPLFRTAVPVTALTVALSLAAGLAVAAEPTTLLGKWMKPNMGAPLAGQDFATLQTSLSLVATDRYRVAVREIEWAAGESVAGVCAGGGR